MPVSNDRRPSLTRIPRTAASGLLPSWLATLFPAYGRLILVFKPAGLSLWRLIRLAALGTFS